MPHESFQIGDQSLDIRGTITYAVIQASASAAMLQLYLHEGRAIRRFFSPFYRDFAHLHILTKSTQAIRNKDEYRKKAEEIQLWLRGPNGDATKMTKGLELFDQWLVILEDAGLTQTGSA